MLCYISLTNVSNTALLVSKAFCIHFIDRYPSISFSVLYLLAATFFPVPLRIVQSTLSFTDDIKGILKGFGVTRSYTGSLPNQIANFTSSLNDRVALQEKLNKAIQEENYEKAAVYRDKLKLLENQSIEEASE